MLYDGAFDMRYIHLLTVERIQHMQFSSMATIEDGYKQVLAEFKKRLKPEEEASFAITTLADLEMAVNDIEQKQKRSKSARNLRRIQPFLQAMAQYGEIIEVFLNTSPILCFVWGPMKFMLVVSRCCIRCHFHLSYAPMPILR
jgi:hypothetical protein